MAPPVSTLCRDFDYNSQLFKQFIDLNFSIKIRFDFGQARHYFTAIIHLTFTIEARKTKSPNYLNTDTSIKYQA